jgi:hypothetical protein
MTHSRFLPIRSGLAVLTGLLALSAPVSAQNTDEVDRQLNLRLPTA